MRYTADDIRNDPTVATLPCAWWHSHDGQASLPMGGCTLGEALAELLSQCSGPEDVAGIEAGTFEVEL